MDLWTRALISEDNGWADGEYNQDIQQQSEQSLAARNNCEAINRVGKVGEAAGGQPRKRAS